MTCMSSSDAEQAWSSPSSLANGNIRRTGGSGSGDDDGDGDGDGHETRHRSGRKRSPVTATDDHAPSSSSPPSPSRSPCQSDQQDETWHMRLRRRRNVACTRYDAFLQRWDSVEAMLPYCNAMIPPNRALACYLARLTGQCGAKGITSLCAGSAVLEYMLTEVVPTVVAVDLPGVPVIPEARCAVICATVPEAPHRFPVSPNHVLLVCFGVLPQELWHAYLGDYEGPLIVVIGDASCCPDPGNVDHMQHEAWSCHPCGSITEVDEGYVATLSVLTRPSEDTSGMGASCVKRQKT